MKFLLEFKERSKKNRSQDVKREEICVFIFIRFVVGFQWQGMKEREKEKMSYKHCRFDYQIIILHFLLHRVHYEQFK